MKEYPIIVDLFTESDCYRATKPCAKTGIQVHSVGSKGTLMGRWKASWNKPDRDVCAGYLIDINGIYQILPEGKRCWLSGNGDNGNANNTHLGFEICEPSIDTDENAADLYGKTLYLCTYLCRKFGINPANVQAHYELHALGLASNHADVSHWWGKKGTPWEQYTMTRLRADIAKELGVEMEEPDFIESMPRLKIGSKGEYVKAAQNLLVSAGQSLPTWGVDGAFGVETLAAVRAFQEAHGLTVDGIVGPVTWTALLDYEDTTPGDTGEALYTVTIPNLTTTQADALLASYTGATKAVG